MEFAAAADALTGFHDAEARGLHHLAAAGYRAQLGDFERARRQLKHARRRLAPYPEAAPLIVTVVESAGGELE